MRAAAAQGVALVDDAVAFGDAADDGSGEEEGAPVTPAPARRRAGHGATGGGCRGEGHTAIALELKWLRIAKKSRAS